MELRYNSIQLNRTAEFIHKYNSSLALFGERTVENVKAAIVAHLHDAAKQYIRKDIYSWSSTGGWILVFCRDKTSRGVEFIECEIFVDASVSDPQSFVSDVIVDVEC